jgi:hypothetical protein
MTSPSAGTISSLEGTEMRLLVCVLLFLGGCAHPDYEKSLAGDYRMVRANASEIFISNKDRIVVVPGNITEIGTHENVIYGFVELPYKNEPSKSRDYPDVIEGYFVIETARAKISRGFTRAQLDQRLAELRVPRIDMKPPAR